MRSTDLLHGRLRRILLQAIHSREHSQLVGSRLVTTASLQVGQNLRPLLLLAPLPLLGSLPQVSLPNKLLLIPSPLPPQNINPLNPASKDLQPGLPSPDQLGLPGGLIPHQWTVLIVLPDRC